MIQLKITFGSDQPSNNFDIIHGELLSIAIDRVLKNVPLGKFKQHESFNILVNGIMIEKDFWESIRLSEKDIVLITPKIKGGESGQLFKQALLIAVVIWANTVIPGIGFWHGMAVAAVAIGSSLILNSLIPPLTPNLNIPGFGGGINDSQMYAITGQSNQMRRLGTVPKVYGRHRIFPTLAVTPYTELAVDPETGETVQYLYGIYDFGLGVMGLSNLMIGDTPLTTESFSDFDVRLVDPNRPAIPEDVYDEQLESEFKYYRNRREVTPLSLAFNDGDENIQFADVNTNLEPQEIILDFVTPQGLFSYSSRGKKGTRSIKLQIQFALSGTSDWHNYNDVNFVDSYSSVGGTDITDFPVTLDVSDESYYSFFSFLWGGFNSSSNKVAQYCIKPNSKDLLVPTDARYEIGAKVFYGNKYIGAIQIITDLGSGHTKLTLDKIITKNFDLTAFTKTAYQSFNGVPSYGPAGDIRKIKITRHEAGVAIFTGESQTPVYGHFRFSPKIPGSYQIKIKRVLTYGQYSTQTADDLTWGALTTAYKTLPIATSKRHLFLELRIKATNQLNGNIQNLSGIVSSVVPIYDPDTQIWTRAETNNPAWIFCDLLTGGVNKKAVPLNRLHMDSIVEWADYCDEVPTPPPSQTYLEPRFQCNFILDFETTLQGILGQIGSSAQASLNIIDGKYGVLIDKFKTTPVQIFTPRNSRDFASIRTYGPRPHAVRIKYIDPNINWEISESIVYDNGYTKLNATDIDDLTAFACTNYEQAWRFGRYMIAQNKLRQETISILVDFENLVCTRGDYVQITQDVMRVGGTPARVKSFLADVITIDDSLDIDPDIDYGYTYRSAIGAITTSTLTPLTASTFQVDGAVPAPGDLIVIGEVGKLTYDCIVKAIAPNDDMSANITLVDKADAIFDYESTDVLPDYDPQISATSAPDFKPPKAVTDFEALDNTWECSETKSGYNYFVELVWNIPLGSVYEFFEVWVNDGRGYTLFDKTTDKKFRYDVSQDRLDIEHGFKVVAVSASGKKLLLIQMPEVIVTPGSKITPPSDVVSLDMSITNQVLQLSWIPISDCDAAQYNIRFSPDINDIWETSIPLVTVNKNVTSVAIQARTGVYLLKVIDFNGNQSVNAARSVTTIPNLFDLNIIETINDAPDFDGTYDQVVPFGDAVILDEAVSGDVDTIQYYTEGFYTGVELLDLDDVYSVRLQSQIRADGYKFGELMSDWTQLLLVDHLNTATSDDWDIAVQYRATDIFLAMADWSALNAIDHINFGAGIGFTDWRPIPTTGDATGRIFQFRAQLRSLTPNVTPRLFDGAISADMPDRLDSFENLLSTGAGGFVVTYAQVFKGPTPTPNVQISIDNAQTGDYWAFDYKTLEGLSIRFYDKNNVQVARQFDLVAKGFGRRHTNTI